VEHEVILSNLNLGFPGFRQTVRFRIPGGVGFQSQTRGASTRTESFPMLHRVDTPLIPWIDNVYPGLEWTGLIQAIRNGIYEVPPAGTVNW